jgi:glycosyltransferase involved in cell wall biosynthesis
MHPSFSSISSLIIGTSGNSDALNLVLASISLQSRRPCEVFVVDESNDDQCANVIRAWLEKLRCPIFRIAPDPSGGSRAALLNRAVRAATGDYLIFSEGDCLLHRHFIADHLRHADPGVFVQGRRAGVRARYVRRISARRFHPLYWFLRRRVYGLRQGIRRPWPAIRLNDLRTVHACNFSVSREDLVRVNGFNESFDESGNELIDLAMRLRNAGLTLRTVTGHAIVYHLDHRQVAKYGSLRSAKILDETRRLNIVRCQQGLALLAADESVETFLTSALNIAVPRGDSAGETDASKPKKKSALGLSHFRDKIVPRSMLGRIVHRSL